jgi:uracil DNA glycosylase
MNCSATVSNAALAARFEPLIPPAWQHIFTRLLWDSLHHCPAGESAATLLRFLHNQYLVAEEDPTLEIYPPYSELFRAFWEVPPDEVRVVLLGQDPYHGEGQAHGLCFSVPRGVKTPPSLRNIFKEREADVGIAGGNGEALLFEHGEPIDKIPESEIIPTLIARLKSLSGRA